MVVVSLWIDGGDGGQAPACANADAVAPQILSKYYIEVETRTYSENEDSELLIGIPNVAVLSASKVRSLPQNQLPESASVAMQSRPQRVQLPMGLEVRERYLEVRELGADAVITVIELLSPRNKRTGKGRVRPDAELYGFMLQEPISGFPLPLKVGDGEPWIELQPILNGVYDRAGYGYRLDYRQPVPSPTLSAANQAWVDKLLASVRGG